MGCLSGACGVRLLASEDELPLVRPDVAEGHAKHATCSAEQQSCDSQVLTGTGSEYFTIEDELDEKGQEDDVFPY